MGSAANAGGAGLARAPRVVIQDATKQFGSKVALDGVSVEVTPGSFLVLLGPSGSGKTTLLRGLAGIERLTSGRIAIGDRVMDDGGRTHVAPEHRNLSMVFQDYSLWPHLTAVENVAFALKRLQLPKTEVQPRAQGLLDRVGLGGLGDRYPNQLSGGEQQRVALARALVANTGLLLFDEPLSNLDANLREELRIEISTLAREAGATSVYITHDQGEAFALGDAVGVLQRGRLVQYGTPEDVYYRPVNPFVARFTGLAGELDGEAEPGGAGPEAHAARVRLTSVEGAPVVGAASALGRSGTGRGKVLIRHTAARISAADASGSTIRGRVTDVAFRGRGYDHAIELVGEGRLVGVHDERRWSRGDHVGMSLDGTGCFFFPDDKVADDALT